MSRNEHDIVDLDVQYNVRLDRTTPAGYLKNVHKDGNEIIFLHVFQPPMPPMAAPMAGGAFPVQQFATLLAEAKGKSDELLKKYSTLAGENKIKFSSVVVSGNPGEQIIKEAVHRSVDAIVMGSRGLNAIRRTFLGSVSDYVLHHSKSPVIIVGLPKESYSE